ncbi:MAG: hypothetical protein ACRDV9_06860 [Acidimicrobiia bacterium]
MDTPVLDTLIAPPPPPAPSPVTAGNGLAVAALVLGIGGLLFGLPMFLFPIAGTLGVLGVIFGAIGRSRSKKGAPYGGLALAGLITGILALVLSLIGFFVTAAAIVEVTDTLQACESYNGADYFDCLSNQ